MEKIKRCFEALGFETVPETAEEVEAHYRSKLEEHKDSTETDRLARQILAENRDACLAELGQ